VKSPATQTADASGAQHRNVHPPFAKTAPIPGNGDGALEVIVDIDLLPSNLTDSAQAVPNGQPTDHARHPQRFGIHATTIVSVFIPEQRNLPPFLLTLKLLERSFSVISAIVGSARRSRWPNLERGRRNAVRHSPPLADWPMDRPRRWTALVNEAMEPSELKRLREHVVRDRPLGTVAWMQKMVARQGPEQTLHPRGRPAGPLELLSPRQQRRRQAAGQIGK
jgi:hypothetical protein